MALIISIAVEQQALAQVTPTQIQAIPNQTFKILQDRPGFSMPNVVGLTVSEAEKVVLAAGRNHRATSARAEVVGRKTDLHPAGQIIEQLDPVGKQMHPYLDDVGGTYGEVTFRVLVSTGPVLAPDLLHMDVNAARLRARRQGAALIVADPLPDPTTPPGIIIRQNPPSGQPLVEKRITVWPSAGYSLPSYLQWPINDARVDSQQLAFELAERSENNIDVPNGIIFAQDPAPGALLPLRGPVTVRVSAGWPTPGFIERTEPQASEIAAGNKVKLNKMEQDNFTVLPGIIFAQQPSEGDLLPPGRIVNITVSRGYPLPDLTGKHENEARRLASELKFGLDVRRTPMPDRDVNLVDRQDPESGTRLPFDRPVRVVVSDGWPTPSFLKLAEGVARSLATEKQVQLAVSERRRDRATQPGIIIGQEPAPGKLLPPGQAVNVVVSSGYPTPRFVAMTEAEAKSLAEREGIILKAAARPSVDFAVGIVTEQFPEPGAPLPADSKVSVTVSAGWPMPNLVGKSEEAANRIATDNKIALVKIAPRENFELPPGFVLEQQPPAGVVIPADRRVRISLSLGWPVAPDAVGQPADSVEREFHARYPNANVDLSESILTFEPAGTVISQHPDANVKLGPDQRLQLVSSGKKPPWTWPVIGLFTLATAAALSIFKWPGTNGPVPPSPGELGGIRLRVTKDHGIQTTDKPQGGEADRTAIVKIRVTVDIGEQSAVPFDDRGD